MATKPKRTLPLDPDSYQARAAKLRKRLGNESDRGKIILCGTILDEELEMLIRIQMRELPKDLDSDIFSGFGPLSSFSGKTKLAYALRFIEKDLYDDINLIRQIRNHLAHAYDDDSPYDEWITEMTGKLKLGHTDNDEIMGLCLSLSTREEEQENEEVYLVSPHSIVLVLVSTFQIATRIRASFVKHRDG